MKKQLLGVMILASSLFAGEVNEKIEKSWFMELGYQTSVQSMNGSFDSTYTVDGLSGGGSGTSWSGLTDNLYVKIGRNFEIFSDYELSPSIGFVEATLLADDYHNDAITFELPLFFKTEIFSKNVKIGPSLKYIYYPSNSYNDYEGQVNFGAQSAFAYGIQSLWGKGNSKFSLGIENLTSANDSAMSETATSLLKANANMDGLYLNVGLHMGF